MAVPEDVKDKTTGVQITSGVLFMLLAVGLILYNSDSILAAQKASRDKRLNIACAIIVFVSMFSSFFNFFQLTEIDDAAIPQSDTFVLDMSRPLEWICTCPLMQLVLVLVGGPNIPSHRCYMMPGLSVLVLILGVFATLIQASWARYAVYGISCICALTMFFFNRVQILEVSENAEGLFTGEWSEFRIATILLIVTWFPFPAWYLLSPEGVGAITDTFTIQVGWAFLNVIAKFSFILYVQKMKRTFLKEASQAQAASVANTDEWIADRKMGITSERDEAIDVESIVKEIFGFLGIKNHEKKFLGLLKRAQLLVPDDFDKITQQSCAELFLPSEVVFAVQQRLRARWNGAEEFRPGMTTKKKDENGTKEDAVTSLLSDALSHRRSSTDVENLQKAIDRAKQSGADKHVLKTANERVKELQAWQTVESFLTKVCNKSMKESDLAGLREILPVVAAADLTALMKKAQGKLDDLESIAKKADELCKKANADFKNKKYSDAIKAYTQALELQPQDARTLLNRSVANRLTGNLSDAYADAVRSLELRPNCAAAFRAKGQALSKMDRLDEALEACHAGLEIDPKDSGLISAKSAIELAMKQSTAVPDDQLQARLESTNTIKEGTVETTDIQLQPRVTESPEGTATTTTGGDSPDNPHVALDVASTPLRSLGILKI